MMKQGNLMYIQAKNTPKNISIKTSTRNGGFSTAPYDSLNMGYFTGDDVTTVIKNYYLYENITNTHKIVTLNQVHGNDIIEVNHNNAAEVLFSKADGLFTDEYNLPLGVITADCLPVMIAGEKCISSLHCGWRSLNGGIIDNAFKLFQKHNDKWLRFEGEAQRGNQVNALLNEAVSHNSAQTDDATKVAVEIDGSLRIDTAVVTTQSPDRVDTGKTYLVKAQYDEVTGLITKMIVTTNS